MSSMLPSVEATLPEGAGQGPTTPPVGTYHHFDTLKSTPVAQNTIPCDGKIHPEDHGLIDDVTAEVPFFIRSFVLEFKQPVFWRFSGDFL